MEPVEILVPLLNANEPEAKLISIHVKDGQFVNQGDVLFSLETTKATSDLEAPVSGFFHLPPGIDNNVSVGDLLGWISDKEKAEFVSMQIKNKSTKIGALRITEPARRLAVQMGIDFEKLPTDHLITEAMIHSMLKESQITLPGTLSIKPESSILIYGAGGHAKSVMELVFSIGDYEIIGIIDDYIPPKTIILGIPVLGSRNILADLKKVGIQMSANGVGGIIDINIRKKIFNVLDNSGFSLPKLIHPRATLEKSVVVNDGVQVFANAYIGSEAKLESYSLVNTNAVVSHDCIVGAYSHIAPGALLAGHVQIGESSLIGMGVTTSIGIKIGDNVRIGNGSIIYADVPSKTIIPSGKIWSGEGKL